MPELERLIYDLGIIIDGTEKNLALMWNAADRLLGVEPQELRQGAKAASTATQDCTMSRLIRLVEFAAQNEIRSRDILRRFDGAF